MSARSHIHDPRISMASGILSVMQDGVLEHFLMEWTNAKGIIIFIQ